MWATANERAGHPLGREHLFALFVQYANFTKQNVLATIYDQPQYHQSAAVAFGFDTSLTVTPGWDNATGYGTPHGLDFINAAATY